MLTLNGKRYTKAEEHITALGKISSVSDSAPSTIAPQLYAEQEQVAIAMDSPCSTFDRDMGFTSIRGIDEYTIWTDDDYIKAIKSIRLEEPALSTREIKDVDENARFRTVSLDTVTLVWNGLARLSDWALPSYQSCTPVTGNVVDTKDQ